MFRVGRSDIDAHAHTYEIMQNPKYGDGSDLFSVVWKGFLFYFKSSYHLKVSLIILNLIINQ